MSEDLERTDLGNGFTLVTHNPSQCAGQYCCIHNPSDHHMKAWPRNVRVDRWDVLTERICPHGIGHPDPDSLAWIERTAGKEQADTSSTHGCDGCCVP